jgi:tetratricopeptide (TPR) repeat protein
MPSEIETAEDADRFIIISPHTFSMIEYASKVTGGKTKLLRIADLYDALGFCHCNMGEYHMSLICYSQAQGIYEKLLGKQSPTCAALYNLIGEAYNYWGIIDKSFEYYNKAYVIRKKKYGIFSESMAQSLSNIGTLLCLQCKYKLAYQHYIKALKIQIKLFGKEALELTSSYNLLGDLFIREGQLGKALKYFKQYISITSKYNTDSPDIIIGIVNLGNTYSHMGEYDQALKLYQKALFLSFKLKRQEHPITGTIYNNIGHIYECKMVNNYSLAEMALKNYKKAQDIRLATLGEKNVDTAQTINNIGNIFFYLHDINEAEIHYKRALEIRKDVLGRDNSETMISISCMASIYHAKGYLELAIEHYENAIAIAQLIKLKNQDVAKIYSNLGDAYLLKERISDGLYAFLSSYLIYSEIFGKDNDFTRFTLDSMSYAYSLLFNDTNFTEWTKTFIDKQKQTRGKINA